MLSIIGTTVVLAGNQGIFKNEVEKKPEVLGPQTGLPVLPKFIQNIFLKNYLSFCQFR